MKLVSILAALSLMATTPALAQTQAELTDAMEGVLRSDSNGWMFNSYDYGSMSNVRTESQTDTTMTVYGEYTYNDGMRGWVRARVVGNQVDCVEYHDFAGRCRPVGQSSAYGVLGLVAVGVMAGAMAPGASSGAYASGGERRYEDHVTYRPASAPPPAPAPTSSGLYGNCHGGAAYGC